MRRLVAVMLMVFLVVSAAPPGDAARAQQGTPELQVVALDGVLTEPDSVLSVQLSVRNPGPSAIDNVQVTGTVHDPVASRSAFQHAMDSHDVGPTVRQLTPVTVPSLAPGDSRTVEMRATARELGIDVPERQQGVYPLQLRLRWRGQQVARITTSTVVVPPGVGQPVRLALLVPIDHMPGLLSDGSYHPRLGQALAPGGSLEVISRELQDHANIPLTLAPSGYLLEQALDLTDGYQASSGTGQDVRQVGPDDPSSRDAVTFLGRVREVASRPDMEEVALTYGPADLVALVRADLDTEAGRELTEGIGAVERTTGQQVLRDVLLPPDGLDEETLELAQDHTVRTVILGEGSLRATGRVIPTTPSPVRPLASGGTALVPDLALDEVLRRPTPAQDSVLMAHRVIAETAAVYFERPFASTPRGLLVTTPLRTQPAEGLLAQLLPRAGSAPWLRPVALSDLQREVEAGGGVTLAYSPDSRRRELDATYLADLADARSAFASLAAALPADDPLAGRFDHMLLAAAAMWYREGGLPFDGAARIAEVRQAVDGLYGGIRVVEDQPVTLTSIDDQQMPVTITSQAAMPLRVQVRMEASPIVFEEGNTQVVVLRPETTTTLTFPVRVITPGGTFATRVFVEDPLGARLLAQGAIQVRSAAYSIVALLLTAGAGLFLLVWWLYEVFRRRGQSQPQSQTTSA
ncbi:MAG: DUF6049 family protein [Egibacteraceae bacterium]